MTKTSTVLHDATPDELVQALTDAMTKKLDGFLKELENSDSSDKLLTTKEVCEFLQIDASTLWHWVNKGRIKKYGIAKRRYYKKSEILESLILYKGL